MSIFKECDIRGIYGTELTKTDSYNIGRAIGTIINKQTIIVSGDVRTSTNELKNAAIKGLLKTGAQIIDIGINPTPVVYFAKKHLGAYCSLQTTASHNPKEYNGFKVAFGEKPITPEEISRISDTIDSGEYIIAEGKITENNSIKDIYFNEMQKKFTLNNLSVVCDAGGGCVAKLMPKLFKSLNTTVSPLYCEFDGEFKNRNPNPAVYSNLTDVRKKVLQNHADFGCAFDGDGDRVVFIDEKGEVVTSEKALCIFMKHVTIVGDSVVYDLKSSSIVKRSCEKLGLVPMMERSGHGFIKSTFLANESALAGEISGHFFFRELGYDDAIYAALLMSEILQKENKPLSELANSMGNTVITPDIRIFVPYEFRDELIFSAEQYAKRYSYSTIDGIRIEYPNGSWSLIRKSVTEQGITLRIEAHSNSAIDEIKADLLANIKLLKEFVKGEIK